MKNKINKMNFKCKICNHENGSDCALTRHLNKMHKISKEDYILKYYFNNIHPLCKCGCGNPVKILKSYPYRNDFINHHQTKGDNHPMKGKHFSKEICEKKSKSLCKY